MQELDSWIECSLAFYGREAVFSHLLGRYSSPSEVLHSREFGELGLKRPSSKVTDGIIKNCAQTDTQIITQADPRFPKAFFAAVPPIIIYAKGDADILAQTKTAGIIGARNATEYSLRICKYFSSQLAKSGAVIVSGFACGIDSCAHHECISSGGKTIAVLGCGIGYDYPKGSLELQNCIAKSGVVISEFPALSKPVRSNFTRRNRLIAALSQKLLVVQASGKSGCLNTVGHALEQGKDVFVIPPHDIRSPLYQGQCSLIRDGASIAFEPSDLL